MKHPSSFDISKSELTNIIDEYIYNPLYAKVLKCRYLKCMTFEAIAEECDLSTTMVKRIVYGNEQLIEEKSKTYMLDD